MKKIWVYLVVALILVVGALGAPPSNNPAFEEGEGTGLLVTSASPEFLQYDAGGELYFHVFNSSSNYMYNNTETECGIHFYNHSNGAHLYEGGLDTHDDYDWEYVINESQVEPGKYTFLVTCNLTTQDETLFGFLRSDVHLTTTGEELAWDAFILGAVWILLPLLVAWLMLYWALALGEEHALLKIFMSIFASLSVVFSFGVSLLVLEKFFEWTQMAGYLSVGLWTNGLIVFVLLCYWMIYLFKKAIESAKKAKMERLNY